MESLTDFFVKALSVTTMLSLGLGSNGQSLAGLNWRSLRATLFISFAALPALTFALLWLLGERNDLVVLGLTIAAASAGGSSAGIFVKAAKGSEGLSGALVIVQAVISSLSLPLALGGVFSSTSVTATVLPLMTATFFYQLLPFLVGWNTRKHFLLAGPGAQWLSKINSLALVGLIAGIAWQSIDQLQHISAAVWMTVLTVNALAFYGSDWLSDVSRSLLPTISASIGIRNLTMALLIVSAFKVPPTAQAPILVYGLVMYLFAGIRLVADSVAMARQKS